MTSTSFVSGALRLTVMGTVLGLAASRHRSEVPLLFVILVYLVALAVWAGISMMRSFELAEPSTPMSHPTVFNDDDNEEPCSPLTTSFGMNTEMDEDDSTKHIQDPRHDPTWDQMHQSAPSDDYYSYYYYHDKKVFDDNNHFPVG